jgi:hypothetical protein
MMSVMGVVAPRVTDLVMERTLFTGQKKDEPRSSADALHEPQQDGRRHGRTTHHTIRRSAYTRAAMSDVGRVLPVLALGALVAASVHTLRKAS